MAGTLYLEDLSPGDRFTSLALPERGMVVVRSETRNQHGDVLQRLTTKLVVFRREAVK